MDDLDRKVAAAKAALVLEEPFFGALVGRLRVVRAPGCGTAFTNGKVLGYDPAFFSSLTVTELKAVFAHEILHCAGGHPWRRDARDPKRWNVACDYVVNETLSKAGFKLPDMGALRDPQYDGLAPEQVYARLPEDILQQVCGRGGQGSGNPNDPGGMGEVRDDGDGKEGDGKEGAGKEGAGKDGFGSGSESAAEREAGWKVAVAQAAAIAKSQGKLPASMEQAIDQLRRSRVDYKSVLRRFIQQASKQDYSWRRPNSRYFGAGLILPSLYSESMPPIVIAVDTSGSISPVEMETFAGDIDAIVTDCKPELTYVVYCDAIVQHVDEFEPSEVVKITRHGGGGTSFEPPFAWVAEKGIEPACLVYLTDMECSFPTDPPPYPVLWVSTQPDREAPWGETVYMDLC